jgi:hypothetical protein
MQAWSAILNPRWSAPASGKRLRPPSTTLSAIRAAREEASPDIELTVDVNCPWTLTEARASAEELKAVGLKWLKEPLGTEIPAALRGERAAIDWCFQIERAPLDHGRRHTGVFAASGATPVNKQQATLNAKLRGHYQYYGRPTNYRSLWKFHR